MPVNIAEIDSAIFRQINSVDSLVEFAHLRRVEDWLMPRLHGREGRFV